MKCTSFWGHNYEPRYDIEPPVADALASVSFEDVWDEAGMLDALQKKTYIHDICTHCGDMKTRIIGHVVGE